MHYDRTVIGYHGCDETVAEQLLDTGVFKPSTNAYDWLGHGIYFWEWGLDRACYRSAAISAADGLLTPVRHRRARNTA